MEGEMGSIQKEVSIVVLVGLRGGVFVNYLVGSVSVDVCQGVYDSVVVFFVVLGRLFDWVEFGFFIC